ncbi:MAG: ABC-2 transporter permease [Clostridia bacterium]|nr:ABC-2 transporter permease [Clostridia bacterium]
MEAVFKREFRSLFTSVTGWIYLTVLFIMCGIFTMANSFLGLSPQFEYVLSSMPLFLLVAVPVLCMRSLAGEKRARTDQLLYSLPLKMSQIVTGKYLALAAVHGIACLVMGLVPVILSLFGKVHFGSAYSALVGFLLLGAVLIAVNLYISSLLSNQAAVCFTGIAAGFLLYLMSGLASLFPSTAGWSYFALAVVAVVIGGIVFLLTKNWLAGLGTGLLLFAGLTVVYAVRSSLFEGLFPKLIKYLAIFDRMNSFVNGIFDLTAVVYYVSLAVLFVWMATQAMDKKRWS